MLQEQSDSARIVVVNSTHSSLQVTALYEDISPNELFHYWTDPALLTQWWPDEATLNAQVGGDYHFAWPRMDWHLRGTYTRIEQGQHLHFTWRWDHEPHKPTRFVQIAFSAASEGTQLRLTHGEYVESTDDLEERQGHEEGWLFFLGQLEQTIRKRGGNL